MFLVGQLCGKVLHWRGEVSPERHRTHNPHHGLGSRLVWREISTVEMTPMQDSARAESGAQADWQGCTTRAFLLDHRTSWYSFLGDRRVCYDNHGSFVSNSPNLFCGPSASVRTHLTSLFPKEHNQRPSITILFTLRYCSEDLD